jgi:hypothetical protein
MIPPPRPPQRVPGPAGPASSPPPWPPRATVAARWPGQASNPGWSLHRGLGRQAGRLLFAPQPHHPPAGNARPQHQQHHPRCLPQQVVLHRKQRAGHRYYRAAPQQPDRVALLAAGFQVGSGHGSSPSQRGTVRRWRWPDHQIAPVTPVVHCRPRHAPTAVLPWVLMARPLRGGPTQRPRHGKERWRGVGVAASPTARWAIGGARWAWTHQPRRPAGALLQRERRPGPGHTGCRRTSTCTLRCRLGPCTQPARPIPRWEGCHLVPCAVKGRCALMSARSACGRPLTAPGPRRPGDTGRPGWARTQAHPSREAAVEAAGR